MSSLTDRPALMDVRFEALRFSRGPRMVLDVPKLTFAAGRVTALVGPNGAGKSTMLRLIAALERPDSGTVSIAGRPVQRTRETRASIAYAFQDAVFIGGTLRSNIDLALRLRTLARDQRQGRIEEVAVACGIAQLLDRDAHRLSGGEAQRANLARALALRAPVTLLDEPLAGLDGPARRMLLQELPGLLGRFALTTILVTHDRDEALRLADDLVVLIDGRVRAAGAKGEIFRAPADAETAAFLGYTVIETEVGPVAVAPGALTLATAGGSELCFEMTVASLVDLGTHWEAAGEINGTTVSVRVAGQTPSPGDAVMVGARPNAVVRFERK